MQTNPITLCVAVGFMLISVNGCGSAQWEGTASVLFVTPIATQEQPIAVSYRDLGGDSVVVSGGGKSVPVFACVCPISGRGSSSYVSVYLEFADIEIRVGTRTFIINRSSIRGELLKTKDKNVVICLIDASLMEERRLRPQ